MDKPSENGMLLYAELKNLIGQESACKIFRIYAGQQVYFPASVLKHFKHLAIAREFRGGASYRELARKYNYSEKHIRHLTAHRKSPLQGATKRTAASKTQSSYLF